MKNNGFTLIELMITIAIIAILASIAYPSYQDSVMKTKRATAQAKMMELASFMERFYTENNQYHQTNADTPVAVSLPFNSNDDYDFTLPTKSSTSFVLNAKPKTGNPQNNDSGCTTLTLSSTGLKGPTSCW